MAEHEPLITAAALAERLNVAVDTVYRMCRTGQLPHVKVGRIYRFTEDQYQAIIAPATKNPTMPRTQRQRISHMLGSIPPNQLEKLLEPEEGT